MIIHHNMNLLMCSGSHYSLKRETGVKHNFCTFVSLKEMWWVHQCKSSCRIFFKIKILLCHFTAQSTCELMCPHINFFSADATRRKAKLCRAVCVEFLHCRVLNNWKCFWLKCSTAMNIWMSLRSVDSRVLFWSIKDINLHY